MDSNDAARVIDLVDRFGRWKMENIVRMVSRLRQGHEMHYTREYGLPGQDTLDVAIHLGATIKEQSADEITIAPPAREVAA